MTWSPCSGTLRIDDNNALPSALTGYRVPLPAWHPPTGFVRPSICLTRTVLNTITVPHVGENHVKIHGKRSQQTVIKSARPLLFATDSPNVQVYIYLSTTFIANHLRSTCPNCCATVVSFKSVSQRPSPSFDPRSSKPRWKSPVQGDFDKDALRLNSTW